MEELIKRLLDEGYEVSFSSAPEGCAARLDRGRVVWAGLSSGYSRDCIAATPLDALAGAAPQAIACEECMVPEGEPPAALVLEKRVADLEEIVAELEGRAEDDVRLLIRALGHLVAEHEEPAASGDGGTAPCECGHLPRVHTEESPDVEGLAGRRMCARDDCGCLAYRRAGDGA